MAEDIKKTLEYLRGELRAERMSWGELHELQSLRHHIDPADVELLQAAGVPEVRSSMTLTEPTHIMGPEGEIMATLLPKEDGKGFSISFDYEPVTLKVNGESFTPGTQDHQWCPDEIEVSLT